MYVYAFTTVAQNSNLRPQDNSLLRAFKYEWLRQNRGVLSKVAIKLGVSHEMVRLVFWGSKSSRRVERALKRRGALFSKAA